MNKWSGSNRTTSPEFRRTRETVRLRDRGCCIRCECLHGRIVPGVDVDHAIPQSKGGGDTIYNAGLLCSDCHVQKTQREANGYAGWHSEIDPLTGWPLPDWDYLGEIKKRSEAWINDRVNVI